MCTYLLLIMEVLYIFLKNKYYILLSVLFYKSVACTQAVCWSFLSPLPAPLPSLTLSTLNPAQT